MVGSRGQGGGGICHATPPSSFFPLIAHQWGNGRHAGRTRRRWAPSAVSWGLGWAAGTGRRTCCPCLRSGTGRCPSTPHPHWCTRPAGCSTGPAHQVEGHGMAGAAHVIPREPHAGCTRARVHAPPAQSWYAATAAAAHVGAACYARSAQLPLLGYHRWADRRVLVANEAGDKNAVVGLHAAWCRRQGWVAPAHTRQKGYRLGAGGPGGQAKFNTTVTDARTAGRRTPRRSGCWASPRAGARRAGVRAARPNANSTPFHCGGLACLSWLPRGQQPGQPTT